MTTARRFAALLTLLSCGCRSPKVSPGGSADGAAASPTFDAAAIARAEDQRKAGAIPPEVRTNHDVVARRRSARAFARIADAASVGPLTAHLADDDPEIVAWAAYGLGYTCKGREDATVRLLTARAASVTIDAGAGRGALDPRTAIARAIGRCGGTLGEASLVALLRGDAAWHEPALLGFGDLATRKKALGAEAVTALLQAARPDGQTASDHAFYAFSRAEVAESLRERVVLAARAALGRPGDARILAIKTLARHARDTPKDVTPDLVRVVSEPKNFGPGERAEAARSLATLGAAGQFAAADALAQLTPDKDAVAIQSLVGPEFHVLYTLIGAVGQEAPKKSEPALVALSNLAAPAEPKPALARRLAELRCRAALALARGAYDAEVLRKCDREDSAISQSARLESLVRRPLINERKAAFRAFSKSPHLKIREAVVEAIAQHPELGDLAATVLSEALASKKAGLVAAAAEVVVAHPERAMVLAESEKRAAADPRAPPPSANPAQEMSRDFAKALREAVQHAWPEDRFETRMALIEAAAAVRAPEAKSSAEAACSDPNVVMRDRAQKALKILGSTGACAAKEGPAAKEIDAPLARDQKVVFETDAGELTMVLEPELAPVTATRIAALVRSGFYKGIVVHRVVPGFVVQFGDPDGDGYGGSGTSLRCETSPVPFATFDVGMALAGRDTGSSQLFVTLSGTPHLDGEYTRVGSAAGDWAGLAQGDVIHDARLID